MLAVAAATASYNDSSGVFENSSGVFENSSAVFDALPLPSDAIHVDAPVPATYAASDELIKLMKAKPNHVDAMRHLLGTAVNKTSDDGSGRRRLGVAGALRRSHREHRVERAQRRAAAHEATHYYGAAMASSNEPASPR